MGENTDDVLRKEFDALSTEEEIDKWAKDHPEEFYRYSDELFLETDWKINGFLSKYEGTPCYLDIIEAIHFGYNLREET